MQAQVHRDVRRHKKSYLGEESHEDCLVVVLHSNLFVSCFEHLPLNISKAKK